MKITYFISMTKTEYFFRSTASSYDNVSAKERFKVLLPLNTNILLLDSSPQFHVKIANGDYQCNGFFLKEVQMFLRMAYISNMNKKLFLNNGL